MNAPARGERDSSPTQKQERRKQHHPKGGEGRQHHTKGEGNFLPSPAFRRWCVLLRCFPPPHFDGAAFLCLLSVARPSPFFSKEEEVQIIIKILVIFSSLLKRSLLSITEVGFSRVDVVAPPSLLGGAAILRLLLGAGCFSSSLLFDGAAPLHPPLAWQCFPPLFLLPFGYATLTKHCKITHCKSQVPEAMSMQLRETGRRPLTASGDREQDVPGWLQPFTEGLVEGEAGSPGSW